MAEPQLTQNLANGDEWVAYHLLRDIAYAENMKMADFGNGTGSNGAAGTNNQNWILSTYKDCLRAVRNPG